MIVSLSVTLETAEMLTVRRYCAKSIVKLREAQAIGVTAPVIVA